MEASGPLVPHEIHIRAPGIKDVVIDVQYAGICHSDIHQVKEEVYAPAHTRALFLAASYKPDY